MSGPLQKATCAGIIHPRTGACVIIVAAVLTVLPATRHGVAPDGDLGSGNLIGKVQFPSQRAKLGIHIRQRIETPAGTGGLIVHLGVGKVQRGDRRWPVAQREVIRTAAINGDEPSRVREKIRHQCDAVSCQSGDFRVGVVLVLTRRIVPAHADIGIAAGRGDGHIPGNLLHRHLQAIDTIRGGRDADISLRRVESDVGDLLDAGIQIYRVAGIADDAQKIGAREAREVGWDDEHLAGLLAVVVIRRSMERHEVLPHSNVPRIAIEPQAPRRGAGGHGRLEKADALRPDGDISAARRQGRFADVIDAVGI